MNTDDGSDTGLSGRAGRCQPETTTHVQDHWRGLECGSGIRGTGLAHDATSGTGDAAASHARGRTVLANVFANPRVVSQSWYPLLRSRRLVTGRVRPAELAGRRLAAYRDHGGVPHVLDARCPHLGADLSQGCVEGDGLRCAFHGWCFGPDGRCRNAPRHAMLPDRRARSYPVLERWGFIWVFNGPEPLFPLPESPAGETWTLPLPSQRIRCHPHLVLGNGLDIAHYERLHGMRFSEPPPLTTGPCSVSVSLRGRPTSRVWRVASGSSSTDIAATFTTIGGSLAWTSVSAPVRFDLLFTGRPDGTGQCLTQTIFFFPQRPGAAWLRALGLMITLLHDDRRVLQSLDFRPAFTDADEPLRAYARVVNALGVW